MDLLEAIEARHSVRRYLDQKIQGETLDNLHQLVAQCNSDSGLNIQLVLDEPLAFSGMMARYGKFHNVTNYIALVGKKSDTLEESCGYYGEKIALGAQQLGLHTCWVALSFSKRKSKNAIKIHPREKLLMVIALGYGETEGISHKMKSVEELSKVEGRMPDWFRRGMEAARLAPTAMNQQKFMFALEGNTVRALSGSGVYTKTDLGIAKYHFEVGTRENAWAWG